MLKTTVAVGKPSTPTPVGRFFVDERYVLSYRGGPYGPSALGVSAHSDVPPEWSQGGPIGVHDTNEPWSIGQAPSHGCVRLPNGTIQRLFQLAPFGTPMIIRT